MGEDALPGIELMYQSKSHHVQQLSTDLLGSIKSKRALGILLCRLQSPREDIRLHALGSITLQGSPVALGPVMEVFEKAESPGELYVSAITLGVLYRNSDPKPRHVFDLFLRMLREGDSVEIRRAGAAGLGECVDKGNATDGEWRALPALLRTLKNERELASQAYGAIHTITGREFAGVHLDINRLNDGKFVADLEYDDQLRDHAVKEIEAWMQKEGLLKDEKGIRILGTQATNEEKLSEAGD